MLLALILGLIATNPSTAEFEHYVKKNFLHLYEGADYTLGRMNMFLFSMHIVSIGSDYVVAIGMGGSFLPIPQMKNPF